MLLLTIYRAIYFLVYRQGRTGQVSKGDVLLSFITGLRFDLTVALYLLLPLVVISLLLLFLFPWRQKIYKGAIQFVRFFLPFIIMVTFLFCVVDFYYFRFFQSHISVLIFGIAMDDTKAVASFIWHGYPVVSIIAGTVIVWWFLYTIVVRKWILHHSVTRFPFSVFSKSILSLFVLFLIFLGIRGTLPLPDSFPLRMDHATISSNTFINSVVLNPVFAFNEACNDLGTESVERDMEKILSDAGFATVPDAFAFFNGRKVNHIELDSLFDTSPENKFLQQHPPNIIFIQMESMSNQLLDFHNRKQLNLLGELESELSSCYVFRNTVPCRNGTIHTLEGLLANTPGGSVAQSTLMRHSFSGGAAFPFVNSGYTCAFITGAKLGWRNIEHFVPAQGFAIVEGEAAIANAIPGTQSNEWGAYDEFLFQRMFDVLQKAGKPLFMYAMTTTNHPRYFLPDTYQPLPVSLTPELRNRRMTDTATLIQNLTTYQYANQCLGSFIKKVKASPFGKNTIIVATGDHNIHDLMNYSDAEMLQMNSVPVIIYMPDAYKPARAPDTRIMASHKDIFPTLYRHSLSGSRYFNLGNDMLQTDPSTDDYFGMFDDDIAFNNNGAYVVSSHLFYRWKDSTRTRLEPVVDQVPPSLDSLAKKANAFIVLENYYLHEENERNKKQLH